MTKRYLVIPTQTIDHTGNILRGFWSGLAEFGSFGTRLYDLSGYPVASTEEALRSDWERLGLDFKKAIDDVRKESLQQPDSSPSGDTGT
jgi:hypothetical protein